MPIGRRVTIAVIDGNPQAQRTIVVERVIPVGANDRSGSRAQYRLVPHVQVIAIMPIIAVDPASAGANPHMCPSSTIITHKRTIVIIPGMVMIDERNGTL